MKLAVTAFLLGAIATLSGCPVYDWDDDYGYGYGYGCYHHSDCGNGYRCDRYTGDCYSDRDYYSCSQPDQCAADETCSASGECVFGDCTFSGCVRGYECDPASGTWECVPTGREGPSNPGAAGEGGATNRATPADDAGGLSGQNGG